MSNGSWQARVQARMQPGRPECRPEGTLKAYLRALKAYLRDLKAYLRGLEAYLRALKEVLGPRSWFLRRFRRTSRH